MKTIWKYPIETTATQAVEMPRGAQILCVQTQHGQPCIWALVDTETMFKEMRIIEIFGTGNPITTKANINYVGTFQAMGGSLIWHVFEYTQN